MNLIRKQFPDFVCPICGGKLIRSNPEALFCSHDQLFFHRENGIWKLMAPQRLEYYKKFVQDYEKIRFAEGRGASGQQYFDALPYIKGNNDLARQWQIRSISLRKFISSILKPFESQHPKGGVILDLGAGCCWFSNILAKRGHLVGAVDLLTNQFDGLGCHQFFSGDFVPIQAEFDHLPQASHSVDMVIYNASFHYSEDYFQTLEEALRILVPNGLIVIIDSPIYSDPASGSQMVIERTKEYVHKYGVPSNSLASENYLTYNGLETIAKKLKLTLNYCTPFYGLAWEIKPWRAKALGQREPARFHIITLSRRF